MSTNQQLRDMLADFAALSGDNRDRADQVARRIRRRRRSRVVVAGSLALALVAVAASVPLVARRSSSERLRTVTPPPPAGDAYPQYADGGRVLGGGDLTTTDDGDSILNLFTPTSYQLQVNITCTGQSAPSDPDNFVITVVVNGRPLDRFTGGCSAYSSGNLSDAQLSAQTWGKLVRLGRQNSLTVMLVPGPDGQRVPAGLHVAAATYQALPFSAYPLPPRPATLQPLIPDDDGRVALESRKVGATGTHSFTATAGAEDALDLFTDGPGLLTVAVDGHLVATVGSYDWLLHDSAAELDPTHLATDGAHVREGQRVTVTIVATHFAGPEWLVTDTRY